MIVEESAESAQGGRGASEVGASEREVRLCQQPALAVPDLAKDLPAGDADRLQRRPLVAGIVPGEQPLSFAQPIDGLLHGLSADRPGESQVGHAARTIAVELVQYAALDRGAAEVG